jgi:hypothetical protein
MGLRTAFLILLLGLPLEAWPVPVRTVSSGGLGVESAALLMSGQEGGEIPLGALALATPGEEGRARVLVRLRIDGPALLAGQTGEALRAEVVLYALGTGGVSSPRGATLSGRVRTPSRPVAGLRASIRSE